MSFAQDSAAVPSPQPPPDPSLPRANRVIHIPDFRLEHRLTAEHVDFFETYGFIRFKGFASRDTAASAKATTRACSRTAVGIRSRRPRKPARSTTPRGRVTGVRTSGPPGVVMAMAVMSFMGHPLRHVVACSLG